jgi:uncharacterized membrane protein
MKSSGEALSKTNNFSRLWEIDTLRGVAIVLMVFYHLVWDLNYFGLYHANMLTGPWQIFARSIATMFIFVVGVSLTLSYNRAKGQNQTAGLFKKYLWRGAKILGLGLIITVVTYFFIGRGFVIFGILHLIGVSIILAYPFLRWHSWASLLAGLAVIGLGFYVNRFVVNFPWLIWLGVKQTGVYMVDFYPLLPWFGVALLGVFAGQTLYPEGTRRFSLPDWSEVALIRGLRFLGRHSLLIYLVHQPVLIGIFFVLGYGRF